MPTADISSFCSKISNKFQKFLISAEQRVSFNQESRNSLKSSHDATVAIDASLIISC